VRPYTVYVTPDAWKDVNGLPGNVRQRVKRAIEALAREPRPARSKELSIPDVDWEVRRLRLDNWRIVYGVAEADRIVDVLAVRKRPPYDYGDIEQLLEG
jgi:mRNA interferase RelE/StbE